MTEQRLNDLLIRSLTSGRTMSVLYRGRSGLISFPYPAHAHSMRVPPDNGTMDSFHSIHTCRLIALYIGELLHRGSGVAKRNYGS
jgi:hypothetical protein